MVGDFNYYYTFCFNLPEGRDVFKSCSKLTSAFCVETVSIYPKAEMGLRETYASDELHQKVVGFNLPEGRDGFKRESKTD